MPSSQFPIGSGDCETIMATNSDEPRESITTTGIIEKKWTTLVTAISLDTMGVADECLSRGLISGGFHDSMVNGEGRHCMARKLLSQIKKAIQLDKERFDKFVYILQEKMPMGEEEQIIKELKEERRKQIRCQLYN